MSVFWLENILSVFTTHTHKFKSYSILKKRFKSGIFIVEKQILDCGTKICNNKKKSPKIVNYLCKEKFYHLVFGASVYTSYLTPQTILDFILLETFFKTHSTLNVILV